jgi:Carboxypeptidase regulatory-like domain/TonB dependent receptor-like, beta-barrel
MSQTRSCCAISLGGVTGRPFVLALLVLSAGIALGQGTRQGSPAAPSNPSVPAEPAVHAAGKLETPPANTPVSLTVVVLDENGVAVQFAQVTLTDAQGSERKGETDYAGRWVFTDLAPGPYELRVEKEGFFAVVEKGIQAGTTDTADVTLNHQRELVERVNVVYSPPAIDPEKTTSSATLSSREVIDLPYTVTRDVRYVLPMLPGVLQDATAQVHVDGSDSPQTIYLLDGFTLNAPASRLFLTRVSVDAIRSLTLQNSRYPAEYGGGTGGVLDLTTGMGDDHFRFTGTDFLPSLAQVGGVHISGWTPRFMVTGPLRKGKAWFLIAPEGEYNLDVIPGLPSGHNQIPTWRYGQLAKAQVNLTPGNIMTGTFLFNGYGQDHSGLSQFDPVPATLDLRQSNNLFAVKDQAFLPGGLLLETGLARTGFYSKQQPLGNQTYVLSPNGASGNYFEAATGRSGRLEGLADLILPPLEGWGRHELKFGANLDRINYRQSYARNRFQIVRADGTLDRQVTFAGPSQLTRDNFAAALYAEDRWFVSNRLTLSPGIRWERDEIVRNVLVAPRLAASYTLGGSGETKLVAGAGLYYDSTDLNLLSLPLSGKRLDTFYDSTGKVPVGSPVNSSFRLPAGRLREPRVFNWSAGLERKLPGSVYADFEFLEKRGRNGFAYYNSCAALVSCLDGAFTLRNLKSDRYRAGRVTARRQFKNGHVIFASYTRSQARSNATLGFGLDNPLFGPQVGGPLYWDAPNRLISWGFLALIRGYDLAYTLDWRSGFPFAFVNQNQQLVAAPGAARFPTYFSLDLAAEKRFHLIGFEWALRAGFDNITSHQNPTAVDNNVDSPMFLTFAGSQGRVLTGRIRLLGRK